MGAESSRTTALTIGLDALGLFDKGMATFAESKGLSRREFVLNIGTIKCGEDPSIPPAEFTAEGVVFFSLSYSR